VAQGARRLQGACHVELVAAAEIEVAIVQVHVAVAHAAAADLDDDLAALGLRRFAQRLRQGFAEGFDSVAQHGMSPR
jgi:hypothetical protein